ncbi:hypothetical protein K505DRAFT_330065 [Melanomma pulvis-pyrius CBS 109.77]|uniref:Uncharacterized protein n=1 Tax=Melanomma pulvis-pyrius CBS 109.77 TaxID=1314802 RepID=A0A6A6WRY0_9PLEO|nr:hypothetical protein K505DRAFT_330065 [Melanomma pulvis-pyrius CBS 109.77]
MYAPRRAGWRAGCLAAWLLGTYVRVGSAGLGYILGFVCGAPSAGLLTVSQGPGGGGGGGAFRCLDGEHGIVGLGALCCIYIYIGLMGAGLMSCWKCGFLLYDFCVRAYTHAFIHLYICVCVCLYDI